MTRVTRILVPTDFSAASDDALACARTLAGRFGASLHLLHAFDNPFATMAVASEMAAVPLSLRNELRGRAEERLLQRLPPDQRTYFRGSAEIVDGRPAPTILEYAATLGADLIVMGSHGRTGLAHAVIGSVADRVVRAAAAPVLTIRQAVDGDIKRILVPTDFSETSDAALEHAFLFADRFGASLQLLHVLDDPFVSEGLPVGSFADDGPAFRAAMLRDAQARLAHRTLARPQGVSSVRVDSEVLFGQGAATIARYAAERDIDLIVMGTHGRTGVAHFLLGSVAERLLRSAPCPVLTVRHPKARREPVPLTYDVEHLPA